ncbi:hypothetical protein LPJ63_001151 [Coemansia sp. RSA 2711]|nr:hypothetical protein LPJ63_001151 [Coemansia sp. RSA 2711]KAJ1849440.1 hypothetical protein LPJ70_000472 [Coemansia sp. RSA 2708]KAJ2312768.1 hypothetical protein IWW54_001896 [Coemansia sp. RSA 2705]KAJ2327865.1 hypothetical protein IWW51_001510 [Coemansia sp. RSA 2702]KAJ2360830.1 hypothetical protein H4S01_005556 [Coemansia sp. RSA 2610]KAJ2384029.1 hypothetical protein H4S02_005013 [Coemansia sp. RSA 2611]KAJ2733918.1 hypothetical protein H4R23_002519 [Coemansia sp. Cherry 401B]
MVAADDLRFAVTLGMHTACRKCVGTLSKPQIKSPKWAHIVALGGSDSEDIAAISLADIKLLSQQLQKHGVENAWICQLLQGSKLYIEEPKPKPRDPELVARLDNIKRQLEEQEYQRMTSGIASRGAQADFSNELLPAVPGVRTGQAVGSVSIKQELQTANQTISAIINIIFSAVGVGFAVGYASYTLTSEIGWRVLLALGAALVTVLAESWLFIFSGTRGQKRRLDLSKPKTR